MAFERMCGFNWRQANHVDQKVAETDVRWDAIALLGRIRAESISCYHGLVAVLYVGDAVLFSLSN